MMNTLDRTNLEQILITGSLSELIGEYENDWLECKAQLYPLSENRHKRELAKDVSSFANVEGGYILLGLKTKKDGTHFGDRISEIRPFEISLFEEEKYHQVIEGWLYPSIENISIAWYAKKNSNKGVVAIKIPKQSESKKPFLIKNVLDENKQVEIMFGYAKRRRDANETFNLRDLQVILRSGLNFEDSLRRRFDEMDRRIDAITISTETPKKTEILQERIEAILLASNLQQERALILTGFVKEKTSIREIVEENGVIGIIEKPPTLRHDGWTLRTHKRVEIIKGEIFRATDERYKAIDIYRDGTALFAVTADHRFLCWGPKGDDNLRINPIALIETIYNFSAFYGNVLETLESAIKQISVRVDLINMHKDDGKTRLAPLVGNAWRTDEKPAPENIFTRTIDFKIDTYYPGAVAFQVVREIYLWFGFDEDNIPYASVENQTKIIDPDKIINL